MGILQRRVFLIVIWTCLFVLFATHLILSRDDHRQRDSHTQKRNTLMEGLTQQKEHTVDLNFKSETMDEIEVNKNIHTTIKAHLFDSSVHSHKERPSTLITPPSLETKVDRLSLLEEENIKLKEHVENLTRQIDHLIKNKKQLKTLTRTLIAQNAGGEAIPKLDSSIPWVFAITPTHSRYTQKADLVRLSQTLQHVTNMHWIIVEDSSVSTRLVQNVLLDSGLSFTHLHIKTPESMQRKRGEKYNKHHRGVPQRNLALKWIRKNINIKRTPGVVYFMDDDNTYHKNIFSEMRWTKKVSAWPVALTGGARFQGPIVENGKITGFHTNWAPDRKFPLDMAAFAVNLKVLVEDHPKAAFNEKAKRGYLEPTFLSVITTVDQLEPLADNCTKVLVWHTRTEKPKLMIKGENQLIKAGKPSDPNIET